MEQKKRGPKPSGEKKRVLFVRVPEDRFVECKTAVARIVAGGAVPLDSRPSGASGDVGVGGNGESGLKGQEKLDAIILSQSVEIAELQRKIEEFEARALEPQSDNAVYWKGKYLEVAEKLRAIERMREG